MFLGADIEYLTAQLIFTVTKLTINQDLLKFLQKIHVSLLSSKYYLCDKHLTEVQQLILDRKYAYIPWDNEIKWQNVNELANRLNLDTAQERPKERLHPYVSGPWREYSEAASLWSSWSLMHKGWEKICRIIPLYLCQIQDKLVISEVDIQ